MNSNIQRKQGVMEPRSPVEIPPELEQRGIERLRKTSFSQPETQTPAPPSDVQIDVTGDKESMGVLADTALSAVSGITGAGNEILDLGYSAGKFVGDVYEKGWDNAQLKEQSSPLRFPEHTPETMVGGLAKGVTQFVAAFVGVGKFMKAGKLMTGANTFVRGSTQGAVADFIATDANQKRLSNLLEEYPALQNPVTAYLAAKDTDGLLEGRLKGALEGLGLGAATEGFIHTLKAMKGAVTSPSVKAPSAAAIEGVPSTPTTTPSRIVEREPVYTPDDLHKIIQNANNAEEAVTDILYNQNLRRMVFSKPSSSNVIRDLAEGLTDKSLKAAGKEKHEKIFADATSDLEDMGIYSIREMAEEMPENLAAIKRQALTYRNMVTIMTAESQRLSNALQGGGTIQDMARFAQANTTLQHMMVSLADVRTEAGRMLSSLKNTVTDTTAQKILGKQDEAANAIMGLRSDMTEAEAEEILTRLGKSKQDVLDQARIISAADNDVAKATLIREFANPTWKDKLMNLRINGLLSGPTTHLFNAIANTMKTFTMPQERILGGLITGDKESVRQGMLINRYLWKYTGESFRLAGSAFKTRDALLDGAAGTMERTTTLQGYEGIKANILAKNGGKPLTAIQEWQAYGTAWLSSAINLPSRLLVTSDEFFKQLNFRADLHARLHTEAEKAGMQSADDIAAYVTQKWKDVLNPDGTRVSKDTGKESLEYARRGTWTTALDPDSLSGILSKGANNNFALRLVIPFIRTPTNLIVDMVQHSPAAPLSRRWRNALLQGGEARADALGQASFGLMTIAAASMAAAEGKITGAAPNDPKLRAQKEATGWRPYSIHIGDKYLPFNRLDPVGGILGMTATIVDYVKMSGDAYSEKEHNKAVNVLLTSIIENLSSKSYLQGITEAVNVFNDPDRYGTSFMGRMGSSFIPYSSLLRTWRKTESLPGGDSHMREMRDFSDYLANTIPGLSSTLPARRSWVTGEAVDYTTMNAGTQKNDIVFDEMERLGSKVIAKPAKKLWGVELSARQYERLNELHGTLKLGGKTLHETLSAIISSPGYDVKRERMGDAPFGEEGPRSVVLNKVIKKYRDYAVLTLRKEDAELNKAMIDAYRTSKLAKAGAVTKQQQQSTGGGALQQLLQ